MGKLKKGRSKVNNKKSLAKMELLKKQQQQHILAKRRQSPLPQSRALLQTPQQQQQQQLQGHKQSMTFEDYRQIFAYNPANDSDDDDDEGEYEYEYMEDSFLSQQSDDVGDGGSGGSSRRGSTGPFAAPVSPPPWQRLAPVPSVRRSHDAAASVARSNAFAIVHPIPAPRLSLPAATMTASSLFLGNGDKSSKNNGKSSQSTSRPLDSYIPTANLAEAAASAANAAAAANAVASAARTAMTTTTTTTTTTAGNARHGGSDGDGVNDAAIAQKGRPIRIKKPSAAEYQSQYLKFVDLQANGLQTHPSAQSIVAAAVTVATDASSPTANVDGHLSASIISLSSGRSEGSLGRAPPSQQQKQNPASAQPGKKQQPNVKPSVRFSLTADTASSASSLSLIDVSAHNITDRSNSYCSNRVSKPFMGLSSTMRSKKRPMELDECSEEERFEILQQPAQKKIICQQQRWHERMDEEEKEVDDNDGDDDDDDDDEVEDMIVEENQEKSLHLTSNNIAPQASLSATAATTTATVGAPPAPSLAVVAAAAAAAASTSSSHLTHTVITNNAPANGQKNDRRRRPPWRLRITNVWEGFELENVKFELHRMGVVFANLRQLHHVNTKQPIGIFEAAIEDSDRGSCYRLLNGGRLLGPTSRIALLPPLPEPTRCFNCQRFGHFASICRGQVVCLKCAGGHETRACTKPMEVSPRCSNCDGGHVVSYKGCPAYKAARRLVLAKFFANKNKRSGQREGARDGRHQRRKQHQQGPPPSPTPAHPPGGTSRTSHHHRRLGSEPSGHRQRRQLQQQQQQLKPKPKPKPKPQPQSHHNHNHRHNPHHHHHEQEQHQRSQQGHQQQRRMHHHHHHQQRQQQQHGPHGHTGQPKGLFSQADRVGGGQQQRGQQSQQQQQQQQRHTRVVTASAPNLHSARQPYKSHKSIWDAQDRGQSDGRHGLHGPRPKPTTTKNNNINSQQQPQKNQQSMDKQMLSDLEMISETRDALKCIINEFTAELSDPKKGIADKERAFQAMTQIFSTLF